MNNCWIGNAIFFWDGNKYLKNYHLTEIMPTWWPSYHLTCKCFMFFRGSWWYTNPLIGENNPNKCCSYGSCSACEWPFRSGDCSTSQTKIQVSTTLCFLGLHQMYHSVHREVNEIYICMSFSYQGFFNSLQNLPFVQILIVFV